ncbi:hypothetical protein [Prevotella melaninogenica]|nr:hypothetical protein [Prevotella melaninogenica]MBW4749348.1 hypothetical protein [Prevotella melaninogenica]
MNNKNEWISERPRYRGRLSSLVVGFRQEPLNVDENVHVFHVGTWL